MPRFFQTYLRHFLNSRRSHQKGLRWYPSFFSWQGTQSGCTLLAVLVPPALIDKIWSSVSLWRPLTLQLAQRQLHFCNTVNHSRVVIRPVGYLLFLLERLLERRRRRSEFQHSRHICSENWEAASCVRLSQKHNWQVCSFFLNQCSISKQYP